MDEIPDSEDEWDDDLNVFLENDFDADGFLVPKSKAPQSDPESKQPISME